MFFFGKKKEEDDDEVEEEARQERQKLYLYADDDALPVVEYIENDRNSKGNKNEDKNNKDNNNKDNKENNNKDNKDNINKDNNNKKETQKKKEIATIDDQKKIQTNGSNNITIKEEKKKNVTHYVELPKDSDKTVIIFYAPWCPHCQSYKPYFIKIAEDVTNRAIGEKVSFQAVSCVANYDVCTTYKIKDFPSILGFEKDRTKPKFMDGEHDPVFTSDSITLFLGVKLSPKEEESEDSEDTEENIEKAEHATEKQLKDHEYPRTLPNIYGDAGKALIFNLKTGIYFSNGKLSKERSDALSAWIDLLHWTLPVEWGLHNTFITDLKHNFHNLTEGKTMYLNEIDKHSNNFWNIYDIPGGTTEMKKKPEHELQSYSHGCSHGKIGAGYTCGLWELLHIATIGASERYFSAYIDGYKVATQDVGQTIRNFILNFFACSQCRRNFITMYDNCGFDHCKRLTSDTPPTSKQIAMELPIWFWQVHNGVNVRLMGERALREKRKVTLEEELISLWPTKKMCSMCRTEKGTWNETVVYDYLRWRYWPGHDYLASTFQVKEKKQPKNYVFIYFLIICLFILKRIIKSYTSRSKRRIKVV